MSSGARASGLRIRRLAYSSVALTFALIVVGGVVRVSDSGLGCGAEGSGTHGWPLCGGRAIPLIDTNMIIEYSHRVLAGSLAILIAVMALIVWRRYRDDKPLVRVTLGALGLVLFQAALGGLTVEKGLKEELVAVHLGIAMIQIGLLILIAYLAPSSEPAAAKASEPEGLRRHGSSSSPGQAVRLLAVAATTAVLATIVAGGYMSASQLRGTPERGPDVHTACGTDFPSCGGEFMPFGRSRQLDIHLTHRAFMYIASALILALLIAVLVRRRRGRGSIDSPLTWSVVATTVALACQVTLGALNVWLGEHEWLIVAHLTVGTILWCSLVVTSLLALRAPARERAAAPRVHRTLSAAGGEA
jgi:cytochrome c oxidase assembly protein subunit 15